MCRWMGQGQPHRKLRQTEGPVFRREQMNGRSLSRRCLTVPPRRPFRSARWDVSSSTLYLCSQVDHLPHNVKVTRFDMSAVPSYPPQYPAQPPLAHHDDDTKAPYDDLIDQYAAPYGTQTHRTYAVDPTSLNLADSRHGRAPSYPLPKQSYSSETTKDIKSLEDHGPDPPDWGYPPAAAQEDAKEEKSWTRVRCVNPSLFELLPLNSIPVYT